MNYQELQRTFARDANGKLAEQMSAYMRNQFEFYGYQSAARKKVYHQQLIQEKKQHQINWQLLNQAWDDPHREMQYFVCDWQIARNNLNEFSDVD